jgi:hypothetical protein
MSDWPKTPTFNTIGSDGYITHTMSQGGIHTFSQQKAGCACGQQNFGSRMNSQYGFASPQITYLQKNNKYSFCQ